MAAGAYLLTLLMAKTTQFASKIGLIAATVGSAVGLGNVWRFPAETQANGGAAFLIIYIACVFLLGVPVMVAEFAIGRSGRSDAVGSFINLGASRPWWAVGGVAILASYMILCFYMVVAGWTLEYLVASVSGFLYEGADAMAHTDSAFFAGKMGKLIGSGYYPLIATYVVILINAAVLIVGVQKGIERMSNIMMPLLFVILLVLCGVSLTLPGASEGLEFFLRPDFSRVTASTFLNALGQAFFSLSLGMGILITYASYFPRTTHLTRTAVTVSMLDLLVALLMGFIIFPAVTTFSLEGESLSGSTLVFVTLPEVFARMPATQVWSVMFSSFCLLRRLRAPSPSPKCRWHSLPTAWMCRGGCRLSWCSFRYLVFRQYAPCRSRHHWGSPLATSRCLIFSTMSPPICFCRLWLCLPASMWDGLRSPDCSAAR